MAIEARAQPGLKVEEMLPALWWQGPRPSLAVRGVPFVLVLPPLVTFILGRPAPVQLGSLLALTAVFIGVGLWTFADAGRAVGRRAMAATVALSATAVLVTLLDPRPEWLVLFYYPAATAALIAGRRQPLVGIAAVASIAAVAGSRGASGDIAPAVELALACGLIGLAALAVSQLVTANRDLALGRSEILRLAAAGERFRIARDLHDLLGHGLSLISLKSQLAGRLLPVEPDRAAAEVADIETVSRRALDDVRAAVASYRRPSLVRELASAQGLLGAAGIAIEIDHEAAELPRDLDEALAWSVREGATNIVRHADARRAVIRPYIDRAAVRLEVANDGIPKRLMDGSAGMLGSGLDGLAERAAALGGRIEAEADAEGWYRLAVIVPLGRTA